MVKSIDGKSLKYLLKGGMLNLEKNKELVNSLNVFPVPDGDTGTNMSLTIKSAVEQALSVSENSVTKVADAASLGSLMGARGNSGVILSQLFRGFAEGVKGKDLLDAAAIADGFRHATKTAYQAVMKPVEGTILTVAKDMGKKAVQLPKKDISLKHILAELIEEGEKSLARTPELLPVLKQAGVVDAGGKGLLVFLEGIYLTAVGKLDLEVKFEEVKAIERPTIPGHDHQEEIRFGYCTEFMVETDMQHIEPIRTKLNTMGDSLIVVGDQGVIKIHVHTNHPGEALELALSYGAIRNIKIDNMRYQHEEIIRGEMEKILHQEGVDMQQNKQWGFISVVTGKGLEEVFIDLGVDVIINGGQTMNPCTEDFIKAIDSINAEHIFILPNNKNIILAAQQAKELSDKNVHVLLTKTIPQGISALLAFDEELSIGENMQSMEEALQRVRSGQVTYAVRDTVINDLEIKKNEFLGMTERDIVTKGLNLNEITMDLIDDIIFEDSTIITVIYGEDTLSQVAEDLIDEVSKKYPDHDVALVNGGQPVYYYMISVD